MPPRCFPLSLCTSGLYRERFAVQPWRALGPFLPLLLMLAVLPGCFGRSGPERFDVAGTVTHEGRPVPTGRIQFEPDAAQGNSGPAGFAVIENGRFDTASTGRGTVGGPHRVVIVGFDGNAQPDDELPHGRPLFPTYYTTAVLPKQRTTIDFDVPAK